ncbi:hypothetical protein [Variovorax sp. ZT4R33]|uniref:hypothetical protein n=1 Tax=Variovorax sp. ZT4R33 TaxID=3443743 RepID=UPI003F4490AF
MTSLTLRLSFLLPGLCALLLTGCATTRMAVHSKSGPLDLSKESVVLMSLDMSKRDSKLSIPWPNGVTVAPTGAQANKEVKQAKRFSLDSEGASKGDGRHNIVLVRMALAPGQYVLADADGAVVTLPFAGSWFAPLGLAFEVPATSVVYLGRVAAELRPRKDDEFRAGPIFPLLDQSVTGVTGGTFDVIVSDRADQDLAAFRETFPALQGVDIKKAALPAFDRTPYDRAFKGLPPLEAKQGALATP